MESKRFTTTDLILLLNDLDPNGQMPVIVSCCQYFSVTKENNPDGTVTIEILEDIDKSS